MNRKRLRIHSQAQQEIHEAFDWYFKRSFQTAEAFLDEIGKSLSQIVSHPKLYPAYLHHTRRRILKGFPYSVIFQEKEDTLRVLAIAHAKRRPGYWRSRT
jgi:plasmid stabilization system protein ParE